MMKKKSFLEKLKLVESTSDVESLLENYDNENYETNETYNSINVDFEGEDFLTVEEVYEKSNLEDLSQSIFKVNEFSKVLPESLPKETKRQSVIGILTASNLQIDSLLEDANNRIEALQSVKNQTKENTEEIIAENAAKIENLLLEIENLKQQNNDREKSQEKQDEILNEEIEKISDIKSFISPN